MEERNLVIVLSDIHMGTNVSTVWYSQEIHEKYLVSVLDHIINLSDEIEEVILLGDIFEFWAYPPQQLPPSLDDIIATHPNILGKEGKLRQALNALKGRMVFIPGDHDMNVSKADLNKLRSTDGYVMKYYYGAYTPIYDTHIQFMHGHECTILNAPYFMSHISPLPIGYFVCRAMSYHIDSILKRNKEKSISDLDEFSSFGYNDYLPKLPFFYENFQSDFNTVSDFIDALMHVTNISGELPIRINRFNTITLNEVKTLYQNKGIMGHQIERNDILKEYNSMYVQDCILRRCLKDFVDIVVMGHTHSPMQLQNGLRYINTGYMCPPVSKLRQNPVVFGRYDIAKRDFELVRVTGDKHSKSMSFPIKNNSDQKLYLKKIEYDQNIELEEQKLAASEPYTFGWSVYDASLEYFHTMQEGVLAKANELGINILINDQKSNSIEMVTGSTDLLRQGINALIIAPYNPLLMQGLVENAKKYSVPVIAIDTGTGGADVDAFIVSDNFGGGILAGEYALDLLKDYGIKSKNFAIINVESTAVNASQRGEGFKSVLNEAGYELVAEENGNSDETQAYLVMQNILLDHGDDLGVVFAENGPMALGASKAIGEAGKKGQIMLIGFDAGASVIEAIKRGDIQGTIAQQPYQMGELGVEIANSILRGEPVTFDDWQEKIILMEVFLVDETGELAKR